MSVSQWDNVTASWWKAHCNLGASNAVHHMTAVCLALQKARAKLQRCKEENEERKKVHKVSTKRIAALVKSQADAAEKLQEMERVKAASLADVQAQGSKAAQLETELQVHFMPGMLMLQPCHAARVSCCRAGLCWR